MRNLSNAALESSLSPGELRSLRHRLSPVSGKPLSQQQFSDLLGVSWSTVARWEAGGRPEPAMSRKLVHLERALDALGDMVSREHRLAFFTQRHPLLLNLRPIDLLGTTEGAETVIQLLKGAETGAFA